MLPSLPHLRAPVPAVVDADVNRVYENASELVEAAARLRDAAGREQAWPAHPAVIACIETTLSDLRETALAMACAPVEAGSGHSRHRRRSRVMLVRRTLEGLAGALDDAAVAAAAARALSARAIARQLRG